MRFPPRNALARLARKHRLGLLVLFGSRAQGRARPKSDVDLAYLGSDLRRTPDLLRLWGDCADLFGTERVDLLDLRTADPLPVYEAFRGGRPLYEAKAGLFFDRYSYAARRFADTRKFREAEDEFLDAFLARERRAPYPRSVSPPASRRRRRERPRGGRSSNET